ncbi:MAG: hypothetical protein AAB268_13920 [Elusimicrobiota bacterium]
MRTTRKHFKKPAIALSLSIAATLILVNAQIPSPTSTNKDNPSTKSEHKDSIKTDIAKLIDTILKSGIDSNISSILATVIGLPNAMPMKKQEIVMGQTNNDIEKRACYVIYENTGNIDIETPEKRTVCVYIVKIKRSGRDKQTRYFRIDLNGNLEKVVLSQSKFDETGKIVEGSGVKFDQDVDSPEVRMTFEAEMKFWLKDWLKKEQKNVTKKSANATHQNLSRRLIRLDKSDIPLP